MATSLSAMTTKEKIKFFITFAPLLMFFVSTNEIFTSQMRTFFIITLIAILAFCLETVPQGTTALLMMAAYAFFNVAPTTVIFQPWTQYIPWMMLAGLIMANVLERTGLLARISYFCILRAGATYKGVVIGIALAACFLTTIAGSMVVPFAALTYGVVVALKLERTPGAAGVVLAGSIGCLLPGMFKFAGPILMVGIGSPITGPLELLGFFETWYYMAPMILNFVILTVVLAFMFNPKEKIQGKDYFRQKLDEMGKITAEEKKCALILFLYFLFIIGYKFTPFGLEWGLVIIPTLFVFPVIGPGTIQDIRKADLSFVLFVGGCMGIGSVANSLGIGNIIKDFMLPILEGKSYYLFFGMSWLMYFTLNFVMTPLAMEAAFTVPLVSICQALGLNPMAFYFFVLMAVDQIILPYEYALYMIGFAFGVMNLKDFIKFQATKCIVSSIVMFAICLPWWNFTGFLYA